MDAIFHRRVLGPLAAIAAALLALQLALPELRHPVASALLVLTVVLLALRPLERELRSNSRYRTRVLLVGNSPLARRFIYEVERAPRRGYSIVGVVNDPSAPVHRSPYLVLGTIDELQRIVNAVKPDRVVLALSDRRGRLPVEQLLEFQSQGIAVEEVAEAYERVSGKLPIEVVTPGQLMASQRLYKSRALKLAQRVFSCIAAVILLILFAPLMVVIAIAIRLEGGAILYHALRLGKGGKPFDLIKFRTMEPMERQPSEWVQDNVERITRVGRWLRKLRLDELPQLINVIRGDMNLVGPRPHPTSNQQLFRESIPYYALRGAVRPGITGWAQVRYHYANNLEEETEKMRYDLYYIRHMSLWLDLKILFATCGVFFSSLTSPVEPGVPATASGVFTQDSARLHLRQVPYSATPSAALSREAYTREADTRPIASTS